MSIENRVMKDLQEAIHIKDYKTVDVLREMLHMISDLKVEKHPKGLSDIEISDRLKERIYKEYSEEACAKIEKYLIPNTKKILAEKFADDILKTIKGIYEPEEFMSIVNEIIDKRWKESLN